MPVGERREVAQCGLEMKDGAGNLALGELVVRHRSAQESQIKLPVAIVPGQIHRLFHRFVSFEKLAAIKEFHPL